MSTKKIKKPYSRHRNSNRSRRLKGSRSSQPLQTVLVGLMIFVVLVTGLGSQSSLIGVLAHATNVSHGGLLASTNQQRSANGIGALTIDGRLNSAAQAKANDMVARDYWSHNTPDGRDPWTFIAAAGYSYAAAGENLAYGAMTSEQTVAAWMNSPGHRANILKAEFTQVGFGFANSDNYQGSGPQTVIVAMYARPLGVPAPAPPPPPPPPAPAPAPTPAPAAPTAPSSTPAPANQASVEEQTESESEEQNKPAEDKKEKTAAAAIGKENLSPEQEQTQTVRRISVVTGDYSIWSITMVLLGGAIALGTFLYRHSRAWHRWMVKGDDFIINNPVLDAAVVMAIITFVVMLQSVGRVL